MEKNMLEKLTLKNFQAHKKTEIEFTPGVNVIVGPSDRGKSSIIRALQLIFFNRPGGKAYIRHGAKECRVGLEMASGDILSRVRTKSKNYYQVNNDDPLKAPGRDVPKEITDICNMQEINFQGQHDSPFMLAETAGECGRMLNRCVDLTAIDTVLNGLNTKKRAATNKLQASAEVIESQQVACSKYADVGRMKEDSLLIQTSADALQAEQRKVAPMATAIMRFDTLAQELELLPHPAKALKALVVLEGDAERLAEQQQKAYNIAAQVRVASIAVRKLGELARVEKALKNITAIDKDTMKLAQGQSHTVELSREIMLVADRTEAVALLSKEENELKEELQELMGDACPLCGKATGEDE
jgi:exonuclease SbcC